MRKMRYVALFASGALFFVGAEWMTRDAVPVDWTGMSEVTITRMSDGFEPDQVYVSLGTRVIFANKSDTSFWPASDLHPSHGIFPKFDPRRPLRGSETWDFVFEREGRWNFHDHIDPSATGVIIVLPHGKKGTDASSVHTECGDDSISGRRTCWKERLQLALTTKGLEEALEELRVIYKEDPDFAISCHGYAHDLGLLAYRKYEDDPPMTENMTMCGQGFFHGYMEGYLFGMSGDVSAASDFCAYIGKYFGEKFPLAGPQCYHGIGHGEMEYLLSEHHERIAELPQLVALGIGGCAELPDDDTRFRCASGVYAVLKDWINIQKLEASFPEFFSLENPYALCEHVSDEWAQRACAWELSKEALILARMDPAAAFSSLIPSGRQWKPDYVRLMIISAAFMIGEHGVRKGDGALAGACASIVEDEERKFCVKGIADGLLFNGEPNNEVARTEEFCAGDTLSSSERSFCVETILRYMQDAYGDEGFERACRELAQHEHQLCSSIRAL